MLFIIYIDQIVILELTKSDKIQIEKQLQFAYEFSSNKQTMEKYRIIKTMGDGAFGVVFKAVSPNNQIVAIKKFKEKYKSWDQCLELRQIKSLKKFDHPNIVKLKEVILSNNQLYLVFDFLETNLYQIYVRANQSKRTLTQNQIKSIFYKITDALAYVHKCGYFHRDLKPQNVLCHNNQVKVCDFGLARQIRSKPPFTEYVSTRWYRAPELLLHSSTYNCPVDIFALACIVIELYTMAPLFPGGTQTENMNRVVQLLGTPKKQEWPQGYKLASKMNYNFPQKQKKQLYNLLPDASPEVIDLLESMLSYNSKKRPSASQILKHEFFSNMNSKLDESYDSKNETKFSFYEKNIIEIPNNIKVQNPKQMQMRRSMIKFGNSFTSSFHITKEQKSQRQKQKFLIKDGKAKQNFFSKQMDQIVPSNKKIAGLSSIDIQTTPTKKQKSKTIKNSNKQDDQITKKFDQMEQILLQLQQKSNKKQQKKDKRISEQVFRQPNSQSYEDKYNLVGSGPSGFKKTQLPTKSDSNKLQGFVFGGLNGIASNSNLKNLIKYPNSGSGQQQGGVSSKY